MRGARTRAGVRWLLVLATLLAAASPAAADTAGVDAAGVDARFVDRAIDDVLARYRLPGLAVGIVQDGKLAYRRSAGETVAGSGQPVTPRTLFKIASNSKAMTAAVLARLVDAGTLRWDDPVRRHLPQFRMHDPWVTEHMQVRDLLIHNSGLGLGAGDLMLWPEPNRFTRAHILAGLAHLQPASSFRSSYAYDNILYIVAGELAAQVAGVPWETLLAREVFAPLGLERCLVGAFERDVTGDIAQPHRMVDGRYVPFRRDPPQVPVITSAAAGGVRCSLDAMLRWAQAWLDPARAPGWLSAAQRQAIWSAQMPMPLSDRQRAWDGSHFNAYGYGWRLSDVDGSFRAAHTGTLGGMYSSFTLLPQHDTGIVVLINGDAAQARTVLTQVLTRHVTAPATAHDVDWHVQALATAAAQAPAGGAPAAAATRQPLPATALTDRLGVWSDPWFGEVDLCADGTRVRFASRQSPLLSGIVMQSGERLLVDWDAPEVDAEPWLHFAGTGGDARLTLSHVDPDADFSYDYADLAFTRSGGCRQPSGMPAPAQAPSPPLADAGELIPDLSLDMRYAGSRNFLGTRVDGYERPACLLLRPAAQALASVAAQLRPQRLRLRAFDCYRPERAVRHFMRWARDAGDTSTRAEYYPNLSKSQLVPGYIAERSGHSRAGTIDLTLLQCPAVDSPAGACEELDMGTPFDFFDPRANTDAAGLTARQRANRQRLREAMEAGGFENYPMEWWHYTWGGMPADAPAYDVPVR